MTRHEYDLHPKKSAGKRRLNELRLRINRATRSLEARLDRLRTYVQECPDPFQRTILERDLDGIQGELEDLAVGDGDWKTFGVVVEFYCPENGLWSSPRGVDQGEDP